MNRFRKAALVAATLAMVTTGLATPAFADGFSATATKTSHLNRAGDSVPVTITGLPDGEGIYVRECVAAATPGTRPTNCAGISDTIWTSTDSTSLSQGAQAFTGSVTLPVKLTFTASNTTAVDCSAVTCGVLVRRDHLGPTDYSLDTFIPVSFAPVFGVTVSKTSDIAFAGETLQVNVAGLTYDQGVYVRLCQQAAVEGDRPTLCDGQGAWASLSAAMQQYGAVNADAAINLDVHGRFTSGATTVDCTTTTCGVFVRRDHIDPTDRTLDTFVPVSFAAEIVAPPAITKSITQSVVKNHVVVTITGYKGVKLTVTVGAQSRKITVATDNFTAKFGLAKGKNAKVQVTKGNKSLLKQNARN